MSCNVARRPFGKGSRHTRRPPALAGGTASVHRRMQSCRTLYPTGAPGRSGQRPGGVAPGDVQGDGGQGAGIRQRPDEGRQEIHRRDAFRGLQMQGAEDPGGGHRVDQVLRLHGPRGSRASRGRHHQLHVAGRLQQGVQPEGKDVGRTARAPRGVCPPCTGSSQRTRRGGQSAARVGSCPVQKLCAAGGCCCPRGCCIADGLPAVAGRAANRPGLFFSCVWPGLGTTSMRWRPGGNRFPADVRPMPNGGHPVPRGGGVGPRLVAVQHEAQDLQPGHGGQRGGTLVAQHEVDTGRPGGEGGARPAVRVSSSSAVTCSKDVRSQCRTSSQSAACQAVVGTTVRAQCS